jgi:eukaryotic-like serine/threonine-protein kinase
MGEVYRAKDTRLGREVAVKVLPSSFSTDPDRLRRFEQEARAASSLNHPNILTVHDVGAQEGAPYVVSELLEGDTLRARLAGGPLPPRRALGYSLQIAQGLAAAHEKGIVHRDLKPENVFVTRDGRVKILDFGLAKLTRADEGSANRSNLPTESGGTDPGVVLGTLGYMSPEQVRGKPTDPRSDIFSFGAILYEMLSGRRAFHGDSAADTMSAILMKDPPELSATNREIPAGLDRIVRHCLEKDPEQRFHSAHDLAFDLEAASDISASSPVAATPRRLRLSRVGVVLVAAALLLASAAVVFWPRGKAIESLAVLPFVNANHDANVDYLSDGVTDGVINSLSQLPNLVVMSRDSVRGYRGRDISAQAAGRELKVQAVLKGSFDQRGNDLLVDAELVDVRNNGHLWGGQFHRRLAEMPAVQEEMARQISAKLRGGLSAQGNKPLTRRYTENPEAYQLYLRGRYLWEQRTEKTIQDGINYFDQAIALDPGYSLAYAGLADAYAVSTAYSFLPPADAVPKARAAAEKALEIEQDLAHPHATLGYVLGFHDWNWAAAEEEFKKALSIEPRYATAHLWYGLLLLSVKRTDEAIAEMSRGHEIDPFSGVILQNLSRSYLFSRQYDRAIEEGGKTPNVAFAHMRVAEAYAAKGMPGQAASEFQRAAELFGPLPSGLWATGQARAVEGRRAEALKAIEEMAALSTRRYVSPAYTAYVFMRLGEKDLTLEWLEKAMTDHSFELIFLPLHPVWDPLRTDPRFAAILRRLNLAP